MVIGEHNMSFTSQVSTIIVFDLESAGEIWRWQGKGAVRSYIALSMGQLVIRVQVLDTQFTHQLPHS
jgi:hypothetical protein